jgi:hypothetical protein
MTRDQIVEAINALTDEDSIVKVGAAARKRANLFYEQKRKEGRTKAEADDKDTMRRISGWTPGTAVYFGKKWNRGAVWLDPMKIIHTFVDAGFKATVHSVQPRAGRVWLKLPGKKTPHKGGLMDFSARDIREADISRTEIAIRKSA